MVAHHRPLAHASNLRRNSHLSESDRRGFPPQIQNALIIKKTSTHHPQPSIDQRPKVHRPSSDTPMLGGLTTTHRQAVSLHSQVSISGHRSIDHRPIHPWWGLNSHSSPRTHHPQPSTDQRPSVHRPAPDTPMLGDSTATHRQAAGPIEVI